MTPKQTLIYVLFNTSTSLLGVYGIHQFAQNQTLQQHKAELQKIKDKYGVFPE